MGNDFGDTGFNQAGYNLLSQTGFPYPLQRNSLASRTALRLGWIATRTDGRLRHLLHPDIFLPNRETLKEGFRYFVPHHSSASQQEHELREEKAQEKPESDLGESPEEKAEKLKRVLERSNEVLISATTVFPFTLFRDKMIVDRTKITITKKSFFQTDEVMSIRIEDVLNVKASYGPFFGSVTIAVRVLSSEDHHSINWLWRDDAINLKHIIQGYIIAHHNKIDCRDQDKEELIKTLTELGHDSDGALAH